jgi:protein-disulfide isomerase
VTGVEDEQGLTRKERREHARAQRKAIEEASASAVSRKRVIRLGVALTVVAAGVIAILIATSGGATEITNSGIKRVEREVNVLLAGIPQSGNALGSPEAPVTLQYFGDLECSVCRRFTLGALPSLIEHQVREGKLRIEYHNLETATHEPETFRTQQAAALAAGEQARLWNFIETFYREQGAEGSGYVTDEYLHKIAAQVPGLDLARWTSERTKPELVSQIEADAQTATAAGFTGTPSFLIGHTGGATKALSEAAYGSLEDPSGFDAVIEKQLKA